MLSERFSLHIPELYQEAKTLQMESQLEDELSSFANLLKKHYELKLFFEEPRIGPEYKKKVLRQLCPPKMSNKFYVLMDKLIDNDREDLVEEVAYNFAKVYSKDKGVLFGQVYSVVPMQKKQQEKIKDLMGKNYILRFAQDPSLLAGVFMKFINGDIIDISLKHRLEEMEREIING